MAENSSKIVAFWFVPILTLLLGWQLGMRFEQRMGQPIDRTYDTRGVPFTGTGTVVGDPEDEVDVSLLWDTWRALQQFYIEPSELKQQEMLYGAAQGLVKGVGDPYTVFMTPVEDQDFRDSLGGNLEGIGAELAEKDGLITVVAPLKGSPAEKSGIMPEDIIAEVNGESTEGWDLQQAVSKIRGPRGTQVKLLIYHAGRDPHEVTITRDAIRIPSVESKVLQTQTGAIGYVSLNQFGDNTMAEVREALTGFKEQPIKGIIVDLRFNGGGYLEGSVELVSMFLKKGTVVTVERRDEKPLVHEAYGSPIYPDIPLVILINQGTASTSEITAGALQDWGRATVVGMESYGKGTVQEIIDLPGGAGLRVTVARWLTPKGRNLAKEGVEPDIVIDRSVEDVQAGRDPQLEAAEMWVLEKKDVTKMGGSSSSR
jgi:carboxyl-terminal processing protease